MFDFLVNGQVSERTLTVLSVLSLWELPWKGAALWRAVSRREKGWFVALLVLHTAAILEILYLFVFSHRGKKAADAEKNI